jgi:AcrR family transcriptional regulator
MASLHASRGGGERSSGVSDGEANREGIGTVLKQERAIETRKEIIWAAATRFDETGYERASLAEIVELTGFTKGALYFHFKSKDDLAAAIIEEQHAISMNAVASIRATGVPALEQLVMLAYEMGREIVEDPVVRAGIRLTLEMSAEAGPSAPYLDWIDGLREVFGAAIDEGDIPDTVDSGELARYFVSAFTGVQLVSNVLTGRADLEERLDQMVSFVLASIVAPRRRHKIDRYVHTRWSPANA